MPATPRLTAYLASLPRGIDSYPECVQKGSVYREFLSHLPSEGVAEVLPKSLARLLNGRFSVSEWLPEVHVTAVYLAIADLQYPTDEAFLARALDANRSLFQSPLYKILMWVISPAYMVREAGNRWGTFHRGIKLTTRMYGNGHSAETRLEFQPALVPPLIAHAYSTAIYSALEASGAKNLNVHVLSEDLVHCTFECVWDA